MLAKGSIRTIYGLYAAIFEEKEKSWTDLHPGYFNGPNKAATNIKKRGRERHQMRCKTM